MSFPPSFHTQTRLEIPYIENRQESSIQYFISLRFLVLKYFHRKHGQKYHGAKLFSYSFHT